jgi:multidrug efflux system membrane fusion protein
MMRSNRKLLAGVAGALIVGWLLLRIFSGDNSNNAAQNLPIPVVVGQVAAHDVPLYLNGIGTIQAYNTVTVHSRVDGELVNVAFHEGQDVKKGDLLAQIDPRPEQAAVDIALANLAKDQAMLTNSRRDLDRYQETAAKGYSSRQQLDTQTSTASSAAATVQADNAAIENARVQLGYTTITAPLDGVTGIRLVDQGNIVHAADTTGLVVITQIQPISALFTLPQDDLARVAAAKADGPLAVTALAGDGATELGQGMLELIDNQIDQTTGTIRLKATFPNDKRTLWPGQFVNIRLRVGTVRGGVTVASRVVQRGPNGSFAFVVRPDNTVELRPVETGPEDRGQILVAKGLTPGERVVVEGQFRLQPGVKVQILDDKVAKLRGVSTGDAPASADVSLR